MVAITLPIAIFCFLPAVYLAEWTTVKGDARYISARGNELWAVTKLNQVVRWNSVANDWDFKDALATQVAAGSDGYAYVICVSPCWQFPTLNENVMEYNPSRNKWLKGNSYASSFSIASVQNVIHVDMAGQLTQSYNGAGWVRIDSAGNRNHQVTVGDNNEIWRVDLDDILYHYENNDWRQETKFESVAFVDAQNATRVVVIDKNLDLWFGDGNGWTTLPERKCVQATINYDSIYCVDAEYNIYRLDM